MYCRNSEILIILLISISMAAGAPAGNARNVTFGAFCADAGRYRGIRRSHTFTVETGTEAGHWGRR